MILRCAKYALMGLILLMTLYLATVWIWAISAVPSLLERLPSDDHLAAINPHHIEALIKIEDPSFYTHSGLDISNGQGMTTITSVVAKMVFLGDYQLDGIRGRLQLVYRSVFSCCKKFDLGRDVMALVVDRHIAKQDQLDIFIGSAYLGSVDGESIVGFERAATAYYGKDLGELTNDEFYGLIAMLIAPNHYHPFNNPQVHAQRMKRVKAVISGLCLPEGWLDLTYEHCHRADSL